MLHRARDAGRKNPGGFPAAAMVPPVPGFPPAGVIHMAGRPIVNRQATGQPSCILTSV